VLRTPLMLRLVRLTYGIRPRRQLFEDYVDRMLALPRKLEPTPRYAPEAMAAYLNWLARQMRAHGQVEFYLERLQPDWLPTMRSRWRYRFALLLSALGVAPLVGLGVGAVVAGTIGGTAVAWAIGVSAGALGGLGLGLLAGLDDNMDVGSATKYNQISHVA
jgi:hypothetical protein